MRETLDGLESHGACVNGRTINNLHFADDIGLLTQYLDMLRSFWTESTRSAQSVGKR